MDALFIKYEQYRILKRIQNDGHTTAFLLVELEAHQKTIADLVNLGFVERNQATYESVAQGKHTLELTGLGLVAIGIYELTRRVMETSYE